MFLSPRECRCRRLTVAALLTALAAFCCANCTLAQSTGIGPLLTSPVGLGPEEPTPPEVDPPSSDVAQQRDQLSRRLRVAMQQRDEGDGGSVADPVSDSREMELLKLVDLVLSQQETARQRKDELAKSLETAQDELESSSLTLIDDVEPVSFLTWDNLHDAIENQQQRVDAAGVARRAAEDAVARAKEAAEAKAKVLRRAKELLAANDEPAEEPALAADVAEADLENQAAAAAVELADLNLQNEQTQLQIQQLDLKRLTRQYESMRPRVRFSQRDLANRMAALGNRESDLARHIQTVELNAAVLRSQWSDALRDAGPEALRSDATKAEIAAREAALDEAIRRGELDKERMAWIAESRKAWKRRYQVASHQYEVDELDSWDKDAAALAETLSARRAVLERQIQDLRSVLAEERASPPGVDDEAENPAVERWRRDLRDSLRDQLDAISEQILQLDDTARLNGKLRDEITDRTSRFTPGEWIAEAWRRLGAVWSYELLHSDGQSIRVSTVVLGLLLLVVGYLLSKRVSRWMGRRLLPRLGVHEGGAAALESLGFYGLMLISMLTALRFVNVPLTVFTFLGGAAAIGLGFGSQNVLNNFISGLILLAERPIRVGDLVEVAGLAGLVESIGMRSTRIRTPQNLEMIVPNSAFLENNVVNWTLSDRTVRCCVEVGVAYGSPTRDVARWLKRAADEHGLVHNKPEPFVWFVGFGDNALLFELHFFATVRNVAERRRIESDLRFIIDQFFREAGLVIAFPQRDVHLTTERPLEIRWAPEEEGNAPERQFGRQTA
ncbi:MAG: mechanosensitive ion channel [Planctomycetales bacterium]|nr:mechanosensitive ion channel [Planctomycetales bacterium]